MKNLHIGSSGTIVWLYVLLMCLILVPAQAKDTPEELLASINKEVVKLLRVRPKLRSTRERSAYMADREKFLAFRKKYIQATKDKQISRSEQRALIAIARKMQTTSGVFRSQNDALNASIKNLKK